MKASMQSTTKTVIINGIQFRVWEGLSETGVKFVALVNRLAGANPPDQMTIVRELTGKHKESDPAMAPALAALDPMLTPEIPAAEKGPERA
jgi:hypothetical protein